MISIVLLIIVAWVLPKLIPYMSLWIQVILMVAVTAFSFLEGDGLAIVIIILFDIGYGFSLLKYGVHSLGQRNLRRHIERKQRKENNRQ